MGETVGIFDAKTRFSEIVERVQSTGQPITVTNRGRPAVDIVPCRDQSSRGRSRADVIREIAHLRTELPRVGADDIRQLIDEGRR